MKVASDEYKTLKKEVSRMAQMANKRLARLEKNNLTNLPAYNTWFNNGAVRFSVKGKSYNELQSEFWRLNNFLNAQTSTVNGAKTYMRKILDNTGMEIKKGSVRDLHSATTNFFRLVDKIKQYNKSIGQTAQALNYRGIWEQVNSFLQQTNFDLSEMDNTESALQEYLAYLDMVEEVEENEEGFSEYGNEWDFIKL